MPSAAVLADQGVQAVQAGRYPEGIGKLTEALKERPAPLWLLERSKAYLRTNEFELAMWDAEKALRVAFDRANRDQIIEAQIRRAVTFFRMGQYADADICAAWAMKLIEGARATEDDGQQAKVDANGDYIVTAHEVTEANKPVENDGSLASAMHSNNNRSRSVTLKNQALSWRLQALTQMANLEPGAPGRKVTITEKYPTPSKEPPVRQRVTEISDTHSNSAATSSAKPEAAHIFGPTKGREGWENMWNQFRTLHIKKDIKTSFYQTDRTLNVDFLVKNVDKDSLEVDVQPDRVTLSPIPGVSYIHLLLHDKVVPAATNHIVKSMKIELVLTKETPGKWPILRKRHAELFDNLALGTNPTFAQFYSIVTKQGYKEPDEMVPGWSSKAPEDWYEDLLSKLKQATARTGDESDNGTPRLSPAPSVSHSTGTAASKAEETKTTAAAKGPAYPTSSKRGPVNWDKLDDDEGEEKSDDVNSFFKQIYKNADEDTKRAMMKSYVESNGTSLSTSWDEAKNKKYETQAPDGAEAKDW